MIVKQDCTANMRMLIACLFTSFVLITVSCTTQKDQSASMDLGRDNFVVIGYVPGIVTQPGFVRHWDDNAKAPYLFNENTNQLVSCDDEESVKLKCQYVRDNGMAGVMFWQYAGDPNEYLINAIHEFRTSNLKPINQ